MNERPPLFLGRFSQTQLLGTQSSGLGPMFSWIGLTSQLEQKIVPCWRIYTCLQARSFFNDYFGHSWAIRKDVPRSFEVRIIVCISCSARKAGSSLSLQLQYYPVKLAQTHSMLSTLEAQPQATTKRISQNRHRNQSTRQDHQVDKGGRCTYIFCLSRCTLSMISCLKGRRTQSIRLGSIGRRIHLQLFQFNYLTRSTSVLCKFIYTVFFFFFCYFYV